MKKTKPTAAHQLYLDAQDNYIKALELDIKQINNGIKHNKAEIKFFNKKIALEMGAINLGKLAIEDAKKDIAAWKKAMNYE